MYVTVTTVMASELHPGRRSPVFRKELTCIQVGAHLYSGRNSPALVATWGAGSAQPSHWLDLSSHFHRRGVPSGGPLAHDAHLGGPSVGQISDSHILPTLTRVGSWSHVFPCQSSVTQSTVSVADKLSPVKTRTQLWCTSLLSTYTFKIRGCS